NGAAHAATVLASTTSGSLSNPTAVTITYSGSCSVAPTTVAEGTTCTATGTYAGDANHTGSFNTAGITITGGSQIITFTWFKLTATASSGLPVKFSTDSPTSICTVTEDGTVTIAPGAFWGNCHVLVNQ